MKRYLLYLILLISTCSQAQQGFRGTLRNGIYPSDGNLLTKWDESGLPLVWSSSQAGKGYSSPVAAGGKVYVGGLNDDSMEMLSAFSDEGKLLWQTVFGTPWNGSYSESRSTPTIVGNDIYIESGKPELVCIDAVSGKVRWSIDAVERYNRKPTEFGPAESPLVVGDAVYFTTMSDKAALIAVDRKTGEILRETPPYPDDLMYASPVLIEHRGKKQIVILGENYAAGIDPATCAIAWKKDIRAIVKEGMESSRWKPQFTNTPIFKDGEFCVSAGYDYGTILLKLNDNADDVATVWLNRDLDPHHGNTVLLDGYLYGSTWTDNARGNWACVEWKTGKTMYVHQWKEGNKGAILACNGMLYCLDDKNGNLALVKPNPEKFETVSVFKIKEGSGPFWAHPTIAGGRLFLRHGEALMVYDLRKK